MTIGEARELSTDVYCYPMSISEKCDSYNSIDSKTVFPIKFNVLVGKCMQELKKYIQFKYTGTVNTNIRPFPFMF